MGHWCVSCSTLHNQNRRPSDGWVCRIESILKETFSFSFVFSSVLFSPLPILLGVPDVLPRLPDLPDLLSLSRCRFPKVAYVIITSVSQTDQVDQRWILRLYTYNYVYITQLLPLILSCHIRYSVNSCRSSPSVTVPVSRGVDEGGFMSDHSWSVVYSRRCIIYVLIYILPFFLGFFFWVLPLLLPL